MDQSDLLRFVTGALGRLQIRHYVTGSIASGIYGEPRFTNDIDIVADVQDHHAGGLLNAFPADRFSSQPTTTAGCTTGIRSPATSHVP